LKVGFNTEGTPTRSGETPFTEKGMRRVDRVGDEHEKP